MTVAPEYTGGSVSYYRVRIDNPTTHTHDPYTAECNDIIEALGMNYAEGNAFKALWRRAAARTLGKAKQGYTDGLYDAEKVEFFGRRLVLQEKAARISAEAAPATAEQSSVADEDGWIKWGGGKCPVPYGTRIDVKYRGGGRAVGIGALIPKLLGNTANHWEHINCAGDIIAYRLSKEASHAEEVRRAIAEIDAKDVPYIGPDRRARGNDLDDMVRAGLGGTE